MIVLKFHLQAHTEIEHYVGSEGMEMQTTVSYILMGLFIHADIVLNFLISLL